MKTAAVDSLGRIISMKLSMYILKDWLDRWEPVSYIEEGNMTLRSARLFAENQDPGSSTSSVYLGRARDFIPTSQDENIICVSGHDMLLLQTCDINEVFNDIFRAFDYYNDWDDRIHESIRIGDGLQNLIDASYPVFDEPLAVYDNSFLSIAHSAAFERGSVSEDWDNIIDYGTHRMQSLLGFKDYFYSRQNLRHAEAAYFPELEYQEGYWCNLNIWKKHRGTLFVIGKNHPVTKGRIQLCEVLGHFIEEWMNSQRDDSALSSDEDILCSILDGEIGDSEYIRRYFRLRNWADHDRKTLVRLTNPVYFSTISGALLKSIRIHLSDTISLIREETSIIILADLERYERNFLIDQLRPLIHRSRSRAVMSSAFKDCAQIPVFFEQCRLLEDCIPEESDIYIGSDYTINYIQKVLKSRVPSVMCHPALARLKDYDSSHRADLYETLYTFIRCERSLVQTAAALKIHRSSLIYRLEKIKELIQIDLNQPDIREMLIYSYAIDRNRA